MGTGLLVILIITAYFALAAAAAPKLMCLIYQDKYAALSQANAKYEKDLAEWRTDKTRSAYRPMRMHRDELDYMRDARFEGFWWSLIWPFSLAFHALGATAFAREIAAQQATANAKVISDYERVLAASFDKELASANPDPRAAAARKILRTLTRKEYS